MKDEHYLVALKGTAGYHTLAVNATLKHYKKFGIKYKVVARGNYGDLAIGLLKFYTKEPVLVRSAVEELLRLESSGLGYGGYRA